MKTFKQLIALGLIVSMIMSVFYTNAIAGDVIDFKSEENLAYKKSVSSPGGNCYSGGPIANFSDGKINTVAQTNGVSNPDFQVVVDLGDFYDVSEVIYYAQKNDSSYIKVYLSSGTDYLTGKELVLQSCEKGDYTDSEGGSASQIWRHHYAFEKPVNLVRYVTIKFHNYKYGYYMNEIYVPGVTIVPEPTPDISKNLLKNRSFESNNCEWYVSSKVNVSDGSLMTMSSMDESVNSNSVDDLIFDLGGEFDVSMVKLYVSEEKFCEGYYVYAAVDSPELKEIVGIMEANRLVYAEDDETKVWEYASQFSFGRKFRYIIIEAMKEGYCSEICEVVASGENVLTPPDKPEWDGSMLSWNPEDDAEGYNLRIYNNGEFYKKVTTTETFAEIEQYLEKSGSYTVSVSAISSVADESPESMQSDEYSYRKEGDDEILGKSIAKNCPVKAGLGGGFDSGLWDNPKFIVDSDLRTTASITKAGVPYTDAIVIDLMSDYEITEILIYVSPEHDLDSKPYRVYASADDSDYTSAGSVRLEADGVAYLDGEVVAKRVIAKPEFDIQYVRYITIAAEGDEYGSKISEVIIKGTPGPRLDSVAKPVWKDRILYWNPVEFATSYKIDLYQDGKLFMSKTVDGTYANFRSVIEYSLGSYTATVTAMAEGHNNSLTSEVSDEFIIDGSERKNLVLNQSVYKISSAWYDNNDSKPQWANDGDFTTFFASKGTEAGNENVIDELCFALTSGSWLIDEIVLYSSWRSGMSIDVYGTSDRTVPRQQLLGTITYDSKVMMDDVKSVNKHICNELNNPENGVKYITLVAQKARMGIQMEEVEVYGSEVPKLGPLSTPEGLNWSGKTISWTPVYGATQYTVSLKRNNNLIYSDITNSTSINLENMIKGYGSYTVTILADAPNTNWSPSEVSLPSTPYVIDDEPILSNGLTISQKDALPVDIYNMKNMFDGNFDTAYEFDTPVNEPVAVALSDSVYIGKIQITQADNANNIGKITVSVSKDSVSWESFDISGFVDGIASCDVNDKIKYIKFDFENISHIPAAISEISIYPGISSDYGEGDFDSEIGKIEIPEIIKEGYSLPVKDSFGNEISWKSSDTSVIRVEGSKTIINPKNKDTGVTLTATITLSEKEYSYKYQVTVKGKGKNPSGGNSSGGSAGSGSGFSYGAMQNEVVTGTADKDLEPETDELTNHWAQKEIKALMDSGIIMGSNNGLELSKSTTRAEFAKMLCGAFDFSDVENKSYEFEDVKKDSWYYDSMMKLCNAGIMSGYPEDNTLRPDNVITREEMSKLIWSTVEYFNIELLSDKEFNPTDRNDISQWAVEYVESAYCTGLLNGFEDGSFRPESDAKREQAMVIIYRLLDLTGRW